jgi:hypothetical protein
VAALESKEPRRTFHLKMIDSFSVNDESVRGFHRVVVICAALVASGGIAAIIGITNPRRAVEAERCSGGQLYGVPEPAVELGRPYPPTTPETIPQEA